MWIAVSSVTGWAGTLLACLLAQTASSTATSCTASDTTFCLKVDPFVGETGYFTVNSFTGFSPDLTVKIGETYIFDQTDHSNWYHAIGFAFVPDGAHGLTWGGAEQPEVESPYLSYKINGESPTGSCAPLGLDCYEPQFFWPKSTWSENRYTAELNVTEELVQATHGGEIYYFCHIHSKMSGRIRIVNADGSALDTTSLPNPTPNTLYSPVVSSQFDMTCGTFQASDYATGSSMACDTSLVPGALDTDFKRCLDAIDCKMVKEMRVLGHDDHMSAITTFMQQMIPHHLNAINMARLLLKLASSAVAAVSDLTDILWDIIVTQGYQVHAFRNWLAGHTPYLETVDQSGDNLTAESVGHHCNNALPAGTDLTITAAPVSSPSPSAAVANCDSSTRICVKVNLFTGESGYYEFAGYAGPSPEITAKVGDTIIFDQRDASNWFHPIGFAYYPDGAHGADWGGAEREEVEAAGELLYKINGQATTCPQAGATGLDCYEPEFFYPRADWMAKHYTAELTITQAMLDKSHGGVIYYFCHIHSKMSGKIRINLLQNSNPVVPSTLPNPIELPLYSPLMVGGADNTCGTTHVSDYAGGGKFVCHENFLCGTLDTTFEKCMQAIDCKMNRDMLSMTSSDTTDMVAMFMQQMIPHHLNAVNMAKILLSTETVANIEAAMDEGELMNILQSIVNTQNYQIHQFRNYLGGIGYYNTAASTCTSSDTRFCLKVDPFVGEVGYFTVDGFSGPSPDLTVKIGETYTFDQTDHSNWYHAIGFAFVPDGAHGLTWGGAEQPEVESPYLSYKINGESPTGSCAPLGLDCYEPQFFWPKSVWSTSNYTAELNVTEELAQASRGGEIYYFCHIHSKMSGRIRIVNMDGTPLDTASLANPSPSALYSPIASDNFDLKCGTFQASNYATGGSMACDTSLVPGTLDTDFKKCLNAIDCKMVKEMRVLGHDSHMSAIATFMQQMIPHHINAINMARLLLKMAPSAVSAVEDLTDILWDIIVTQGYQVHAFRNWLAGHSPYTAVTDQNGAALTAESVGHHCDNTLPAGTDLTIPAGTPPSATTTAVAGCTASDTTVCVKVNLVAGESGYYEFAGKMGPSPEITAKVGDTIIFDQRDPSNWFHPIGFAYYPDGAHGSDWGGAEREEVEGQGELLYKINGAATTCPAAGNTGLDCYEPEFFYPTADWLAKKYSAQLTVTQAMLDKSHGGVIYYFCHIHSKMSGKIRILKADGTAVDTSTLQNPSELPLYQATERASADITCGTTHITDYAGGGSMVCSENFLCGTLDTSFEKCMQAIDCKMNRDMLSMTQSDTTDMVAMFMQQMIPHHLNAMNMAKILLTTESAANIEAAMEESELAHILSSIINTQGYQIHQFRNYLGGTGFYTTMETTTVEAAFTSTSISVNGAYSVPIRVLCLVLALFSTEFACA